MRLGERRRILPSLLGISHDRILVICISESVLLVINCLQRNAIGQFEVLG